MSRRFDGLQAKRLPAWSGVIRIGQNSITIEASGNRSFPEFDRLYIPRISEPRQGDDYSDELVPTANVR